MRLNINLKIALVCCALVLATGVVVTYLVFNATTKMIARQALEQERSILREQVDAVKGHLGAQVRMLEEDVKILANISSLRGFLRALRSPDGVDVLPAGRRTELSVYESRVENIFKSFLKERPNYEDITVDPHLSEVATHLRLNLDPSLDQ